MNTLQVGDKAPLFTLNDQNGNPVSLADLTKDHQVLVYFYPKAMTPGCIIQAEGIRDHKDDIAGLNTVVVGISPDPVKKLANFVEKKSLNFTLLSDEDHAVADQFGVWGLKKFMGREYDGIHRLSFLVGKDNTIKHVFTKFKTKTHHEVVMDVLKEG